MQNLFLIGVFETFCHISASCVMKTLTGNEDVCVSAGGWTR